MRIFKDNGVSQMKEMLGLDELIFSIEKSPKSNNIFIDSVNLGILPCFDDDVVKSDKEYHDKLIVFARKGSHTFGSWFFMYKLKWLDLFKVNPDYSIEGKHIKEFGKVASEGDILGHIYGILLEHLTNSRCTGINCEGVIFKEIKTNSSDHLLHPENVKKKPRNHEKELHTSDKAGNYYVCKNCGKNWSIPAGKPETFQSLSVLSDEECEALLNSFPDEPSQE